jgi:hypothetical protein
MSQNDSIRSRRRAGFSLVTAVGGALAAAALSMGTAHADPTVVVDGFAPPDPYDILFGAAGGDVIGSQGYDNAQLDTSLLESNPSGFASFSTDVITFEQAAGEHGLENLIFAIDPSAFDLQTSADVVGTVGGASAEYLVPESALGYLAVGLDYGLLTPSGLDFVLTPLIDALLGNA